MTQKSGQLDSGPNPLVVLFKLLSNSLLEDKYGINTTAYNALLIFAATIDKQLAVDLKKKTAEFRGRYRYED
jgi:hypothetical protein